jgi:chaperonin cofactor prefoldin
MMEKILTMLVGLLIALGGWSLSRTFELSTSQAVLEDKVERLEFEIRTMDDKMDEMFDADEEIMEQHEKLFKKLEQGNTSSGYSYN